MTSKSSVRFAATAPVRKARSFPAATLLGQAVQQTHEVPGLRRCCSAFRSSGDLRQLDERMLDFLIPIGC
jgi:hypothetical protein